MKSINKIKLFILVFMPVMAIAQDRHIQKGSNSKEPPRTEFVSCGLAFNGGTELQAVTKVQVQNDMALSKGQAQGFEYILSVRGKMSVAILKEVSTGNQIKAQGSIELLRGGGRSKESKVASIGENQENEEREGGIELSFKEVSASGDVMVALKCASTNIKN